VGRYYDTSFYDLSTKDIWLRQRELSWECKVPTKLAREFPETSMATSPTGLQAEIVDQYVELENEAGIIDFLVNKSIASYPSHFTEKKMHQFISHNNMFEFAKIESHRRKFLLREFTIDLDMTDFGYGIGEVELMVSSQDEVELAKKKIQQFCSEMGFTVGVRGKVLEYLYRNSPQHFNALLQSGLVGQKLKLQK